MKRHWKNLAGIFVIFLLGVTTGALVSRTIEKREVGRLVDNGPAGYRALMVDRLSHQLSLSAQQRDQLALIMDNSSARLREARLPVYPQVKASLEQTESEIRAILTPDQVAKFEPIAAQSRARIQKYGESANPRP